MTVKLHEMFGNLHDQAVSHVSSIVPEIWNVDEEEAVAMFDRLSRDLSNVYGIPKPEVVMNDEPPARYYIPGETIILDTVSLTTFLHEFRHHMQNHGKQVYGNIEMDAQGWAASMFAEAAPRHFDIARREGSIRVMGIVSFDEERGFLSPEETLEKLPSRKEFREDLDKNVEEDDL